MSHDKKQIKKKFLELIEQNPIVQIACNKLNVGRSTIYHWLEKDKRFMGAYKKAQKIGNGKICDVGESKLIQNVDRGDQRAIEFLLKHKSSDYRDSEDTLSTLKKLEIHKLEEERLKLSKEYDDFREDSKRMFELIRESDKHEKELKKRDQELTEREERIKKAEENNK